MFTRELPEEVEFRGDAYGHLRRIYALRGDHEQALAWGQKELEHEIEISNPGSVAVAQRGLQVVALKRHSTQQSHRHLRHHCCHRHRQPKAA